MCKSLIIIRITTVKAIEKALFQSWVQAATHIINWRLTVWVSKLAVIIMSYKPMQWFECGEESGNEKRSGDGMLPLKIPLGVSSNLQPSTQSCVKLQTKELPSLIHLLIASLNNWLFSTILTISPLLRKWPANPPISTFLCLCGMKHNEQAESILIDTFLLHCGPAVCGKQ